MGCEAEHACKSPTVAPWNPKLCTVTSEQLLPETYHASFLQDTANISQSCQSYMSQSQCTKGASQSELEAQCQMCRATDLQERLPCVPHAAGHHSHQRKLLKLLQCPIFFGLASSGTPGYAWSSDTRVSTWTYSWTGARLGVEGLCGYSKDYQDTLIVAFMPKHMQHTEMLLASCGAADPP